MGSGVAVKRLRVSRGEVQVWRRSCAPGGSGEHRELVSLVYFQKALEQTMHSLKIFCEKMVVVEEVRSWNRESIR